MDHLWTAIWPRGIGLSLSLSRLLSIPSLLRQRRWPSASSPSSSSFLVSCLPIRPPSLFPLLPRLFCGHLPICSFLPFSWWQNMIGAIRGRPLNTRRGKQLWGCQIEGRVVPQRPNDSVNGAWKAAEERQ